MLPSFPTPKGLQRLTSCFAEAAELFGLEVSSKKTEVLQQPALLEEYRSPHITIGGTDWKQFTGSLNLKCTITSDTKIDREVDNGLTKVNSASDRLYKRVWNSKHLKKCTKICVCWAVKLTILLYGSESWVTYRHHLQLLEQTLGTCHIDHRQWLTLAADRQAWRGTVHQVVSTFEDACWANLREKRRRRKIQGAFA